MSACGDGNAKPIPAVVPLDRGRSTFKDRLYDLWLSPVNGLYGIQPDQEVVEAPEKADSFDGIDCVRVPARGHPSRRQRGLPDSGQIKVLDADVAERRALPNCGR